MATKIKLVADGVVTADQLTLTTASTGTNTTAPATTAFVQQEISALVDSSPDALNTLNELAAALGDDANFSTTVTNSIATKLPLAGGTMTGALTVTADANPALEISRGSANTTNVNLKYNTTLTGQLSAANAEFQISAAGSSTPMEFFTNGSERMRIQSNGEVEISGIGNTSGARLNIGSDANNAFVRSYDTAAGIIIGTTNAHPVKFMSNSSERMRINATGGLSINDDVENGLNLNRTTTTTGASYIKFTNSGGNYYIGADSSAGDRMAIGGQAYGFTMTAESGRPLVFATSNTSRMTIDSSGNVGIGTDNPSSILHLEGNTNSYSTSPLLYFGSTSTQNAAVRDWAIGPADSNYGDFHIFQGASTGASAIGSTQIVFTINSSGNVGIGDRNPNSRLTVANTAAGDGSNIADFIGSDINQRLVVSNFTCGSDEDRVGLIWENQGVALWRNWMDDAGNLRLKNSNPTSNTDGKRIVTTESDIGRTIIESFSIGNVASASADFQGGVGVASAGIQKFTFSIQGDNTWRTVLSNVHDCSFEMTATVGDAASRDNAAYSATITSPAYGVSHFTNIYYHNGGWNTGTYEFRIVSAGIDYNIECRFSSYYASTNVASGFLIFKRLY